MSVSGVAVKNTREVVLEQCVHMFAKSGYHGVSMRDIANSIGTTPAAIYYHFSNKDELFFESIKYSFENATSDLMHVFNKDEDSIIQLEHFITHFSKIVSTNKEFQRLLQWVLLEGDEERLHELVENVFQELFLAVRGLAKNLDSSYDPHLLASSILSLVIYHFQTMPARKHIPGNYNKHDQADIVSKHVIKLLFNGLTVKLK